MCLEVTSILSYERWGDTIKVHVKWMASATHLSLHLSVWLSTWMWGYT